MLLKPRVTPAAATVPRPTARAAVTAIRAAATVTAVEAQAIRSRAAEVPAVPLRPAAHRSPSAREAKVIPPGPATTTVIDTDIPPARATERERAAARSGRNRLRTTPARVRVYPAANRPVRLRAPIPASA